MKILKLPSPKFLICYAFGIVFLLTSCKRTSVSSPQNDVQVADTTNVTSQAFVDKMEAKEALSGKVIHVDDGDTYTLLLPNQEKLKVRMEGIDAPEGGMPYYRRSKNFLIDLIKEETVKLQVTGKDKNGRILGFTYVNDTIEASEALVKNGLAWHYKAFNTDKRLSNLEIKAKHERIGLWEEKDPVPPWIIRRLRRQGISTKNKLNPFKENRFSLKTDHPIVVGDLKISIHHKGNEFIDLVLFKEEAQIQTLHNIAINGANKNPEIFIADYNMDGSFDIMLDFDTYHTYFFYARENRVFRENSSWDVKVWKQNKHEKEFLSYPIEGDEYKGYVRYYKLGEDNTLQIKRVIKYYYN